MSWKSNAMWKVTGAVVISAVVSLGACQDFLEVQDPGRYTDDALNTPLALAAVANGVEGDFTSNMSGLAWSQGLMSDEYMHTGTWNPDEDLDQGRVPTLISQGGQSQGGWLSARTASQKAQERFKTVMGDTAEKSLLFARVAAVEAWSNLFLGMYNCESPVGPDGMILSDIDMLKLSIPQMTRAANIAKAANSVVYERFAISGRARANLLAGNLDAALADAGTIPDNYQFAAKYSSASAAPGNYIATVSYRTRLKAAGLDTRHWAAVDTIAGFYKDPWTGALDRRLGITHPRNERGADGVKQHYNQEKYKDPGDDILMTHGLEMRLIEAEVLMKKNDLEGAIAKINYVRNLGGLAPVTATTRADVEAKLLHERFIVLYLEGHRMVDLARFNRVRTVLGPNRATKHPLTSGEITLNTNVLGRLEGRCMPMS